MSDNVENIEIYRKKLMTPVEANVGDIRDWFSDYHEQDCCEDASADWSPLDSMKEEVGWLWKITEVSISTTPDMGFTVFFYNGEEAFGDPKRVGVFIPCYSYNNGYYSDNLTLVVDIEWNKEEIRIDKYVF